MSFGRLMETPVGSLPDISTDRGHSVDKQFFLDLAAKIIDELKKTDA
jgi:hypothetical protein